MIRTRQFIVLLTLLVLSACATTQTEVEALDQSMKNYEMALRWGEYAYAQSMHKASSEFDPTVMARLREIKISSYSSLNSTISPDLASAKQYVEIRYFNEAEAVERTFIDEQKWEYDPLKKSWSITSPFPTFK